MAEKKRYKIYLRMFGMHTHKKKNTPRNPDWTDTHMEMIEHIIF